MKWKDRPPTKNVDDRLGERTPYNPLFIGKLPDGFPLNKSPTPLPGKSPAAHQPKKPGGPAKRKPKPIPGSWEAPKWFFKFLDTD